MNNIVKYCTSVHCPVYLRKDIFQKNKIAFNAKMIAIVDDDATRLCLKVLYKGHS